MTKIRYIIFDLGGVIILHGKSVMPEIIAEMFAIESSSAQTLWHTYQHRLLDGSLTSEAFLNEVKQLHKLDDQLHILLKKWDKLYIEKSQTINTYILTLIDRLRKNYKTVLLTDTFDVHDTYNEGRGLYSHFDYTFRSHLIKKTKSQGSEIFHHVLKKLHAKPEECIFVDDLQTYIDIASSLGIHAILFISNDDLNSKLMKMRIM